MSKSDQPSLERFYTFLKQSGVDRQERTYDQVEGQPSHEWQPRNRVDANNEGEGGDVDSCLEDGPLVIAGKESIKLRRPLGAALHPERPTGPIGRMYRIPGRESLIFLALLSACAGSLRLGNYSMLTMQGYDPIHEETRGDSGTRITCVQCGRREAWCLLERMEECVHEDFGISDAQIGS